MYLSLSSVSLQEMNSLDVYPQRDFHARFISNVSPDELTLKCVQGAYECGKWDYLSSLSL